MKHSKSYIAMEISKGFGLGVAVFIVALSFAAVFAPVACALAPACS